LSTARVAGRRFGAVAGLGVLLAVTVSLVIVSECAPRAEQEQGSRLAGDMAAPGTGIVPIDEVEPWSSFTVGDIVVDLPSNADPTGVGAYSYVAGETELGVMHYDSRGPMKNLSDVRQLLTQGLTKASLSTSTRTIGMGVGSLHCAAGTFANGQSSRRCVWVIEPLPGRIYVVVATSGSEFIGQVDRLLNSVRPSPAALREHALRDGGRP
jgi:hypothetical protein